MENNYVWDLTKLFKNDDEFIICLQKYEQDANKITKYRNNICESASNLYSFMKDYEDLLILFERLDVYATLKVDANSLDKNNIGLLSKINSLREKTSPLLSFIDKELSGMNKKQLTQFFKDEPLLKEYKFYFEKIFALKKHTPSTKENELISSISAFGNAFAKEFSILRNNEIKFSDVIIDGVDTKITFANYGKYLKHDSRDVRKAVYESFNKEIFKHNNTFANILLGNFKYRLTVSKLLKYSDPLEQTIEENYLDKKMITNLISIVQENGYILGNYYKLIKEKLKLDKLYPYDINVNLTLPKKEYIFSEHLPNIFNALNVLGEDYQKQLKRLFTEGNIDVFSREGKEAQGYNMTNYINPYINVNYENRFQDVSTIAHECGHAINCIYATKNNSYFYYRNSLIISEVVSLTNELLVGKYYLKHSNSKDEKKAILERFINLYIGNFFESTKRCMFENTLYDNLNAYKPLTSTDLNETWKNINMIFDPDNIIEKNDEYIGWSTIPHYYLGNYYNYQYAYGISVASFVAEEIFNNNIDMINKYLKFLTFGFSKYPIEAIKYLGIDIRDPKILKNTVEIINKYIEELKKLERDNNE